MPDKKTTVLVVDDTPANIVPISGILKKKGYQVLASTKGAQALELASTHHPDLILLDIMMPEMDGYEVCERLKNNEETKTIPVIFVTGKGEAKDEAKGLSLGAVDYITKPFHPVILLARVCTHLELKDARDTVFRQTQKLAQISLKLKNQVIEKTQEIRTILGNAINLLISLVEMRSQAMAGHGHRVSELSRELSKHMQLSDEETDLISTAGLLHDIGILGFEKRFDRENHTKTEEMQFREHSEIGAMLVESIGLSGDISALIKLHHEHWDGTGYPAGLTKNNIPLGARIIAIADMFDRIVYSVYLDNKPFIRDYQKSVHSISSDSSIPAPGLAEQAALHFIGQKGFSWFDHSIVKAFLEMMAMKGLDRQPEAAISLGQVSEGMRLAKPIYTIDGDPLLPHGTMLSVDYIKKLKDFWKRGQIDETVYVVGDM